MKKLLLTGTAAAALVAGPALADDVKIGVILGFTGPIESLTPQMADSAELAMTEINDAGGILDGSMLTSVRADSTCIDSAAATAAAERLITAEGVAAIMGADCSGVTIAILQNVAVPNGTVMISPSATSPALTSIEDNGLFFRTAPSDARQGQVLSDILTDKDIGEVAVTYTNNDYGKGLSDSFVSAFEAAGGSVTINVPHDDGKGDYSAEVGALASAGGEVLVVLGYADQGGKGIIQGSLDTGAFETFVMGDGMYSEALLADLGADLSGWTFWGLPSNAERLRASVLTDVTSLTNFGLIGGAFVIAAWRRGALAAKVAPLPARAWIAAVVAGLILGYTSRVAFGCNVGAFFSGVSTGSLHGWVWFAAAFAGSYLGIWARPRLGLEPRT